MIFDRKNPPWAFPVILFVLNLFVLVSLVSKGPYHGDCLYLVTQVDRTLASGKLLDYFWPGYSLFFLMTLGFSSLAQTFFHVAPVTGVNLMNAILGAACIPIFLLFCKRLIDQPTAFYSSILLSTLPMFSTLSTYGNSHISSLFFLVCGLFFLLKAETRRTFLPLSALCFAAMANCRTQDFLFMLPAVGYLFFLKSPARERTPRKFRNLIFFLSLIAALMLMMQWPWLSKDGLSVYGNFILTFRKAAFPSNALWAKSLFPSSVKLLATVSQKLSLPHVLLSLAGMALLIRERPRVAVFLVLCLLGPLIFYIQIFTFTSRYLLNPLAAILIPAGYLVSRLSASRMRLIRILTIVVFLVINILALARIAPVLIFRNHFDVMPEFGRQVGRITEPEAVIIASDEAGFISYFGKRATCPWPVDVFTDHSQDYENFRHWLSGRWSAGQPVYIVLFPHYANKINQLFIRYLCKDYRLRRAGILWYEDWHKEIDELKIIPCYLYEILPADDDGLLNKQQ